MFRRKSSLKTASRLWIKGVKKIQKTTVNKITDNVREFVASVADSFRAPAYAFA